MRGHSLVAAYSYNRRPRTATGHVIIYPFPSLFMEYPAAIAKDGCVISGQRPAAPASKGVIETGAFHKFLDNPCAFCAKTPIFRSKNDRLRKRGASLTSYKS